MSIFGQVWLWSLIAFVVGAVLAWAVLALPAQRRARQAQERLAQAEQRAAAASADAARTKPPTADQPDWSASEPMSAGGRAEAAPVQPEPTMVRPSWLDRDSLADRDITTPAQPEVTPPAEPVQPEPTSADATPAGQLLADQMAEQARLDEARFAENLAGTAEADEPAVAHLDDFAAARPAIHETTGEAVTGAPTPTAEALDAVDAHTATERTDPPGGPESDVEITQVLPKRQPGSSASPAGSFEGARPLQQPSMRPTPRRDAATPDDDAPKVSLFEPAVKPDGAKREPAPTDSLPQQSPDAGHGNVVPPGPFGPGSAMPKPGGGQPSPDFTVKASVTALRYCTPDSPHFAKMVAEIWFRNADDAERVGFRPVS